MGAAGKIYTAKHEQAARELLSQMDLTNITHHHENHYCNLHSIYSHHRDKEREKCTCL